MKRLWVSHPLASASAALVLLTLAFTWPQVTVVGTSIAGHQDPYLSTWRIAWIAHALATDPLHVFDGNIFHPLPRTLALSDATLLEGLAGAPFFWTHVAPITVYNLLLLGGIAGSGIGMFVLARHLTGSPEAALVSAAIFTMAPYRIEHYMHLELQWAMWIPLAFWAAHRTVEDRSWRFGLLTGAFLSLQVFSSIYYGAFLGMLLAVLCPLLLAMKPRHAPAAAACLLLGALVAIVLVLPYARPYLQNAGTVGPRSEYDIRHLSATALSYLASPPQSLLWGWTADRFGNMELRLYPGIVAVALALAAFGRRSPRIVWIWAAVCVAAIVLSFGLNTPVYRWLYAHLWIMGGFRAPSRFGIFAVCAVAVLAGFGTTALRRHAARSGRGALVVPAAFALVALDFWAAPMSLMSVPGGVPDVYVYLRGLPPGVVLEMPATLEIGPHYEPEFEFWSTTHWRPLVNGYSGFMPAPYAETLTLMEHFPDSRSVAHLKRLSVRYLIVHESLYANEGRVGSLLYELERRAEVLPRIGRYRDWQGWADVYELK